MAPPGNFQHGMMPCHAYPPPALHPYPGMPPCPPPPLRRFSHSRSRSLSRRSFRNGGRGRGRRKNFGGRRSSRGRSPPEREGGKGKGPRILEEPPKLFGDAWEEPKDRNGLQLISDLSPPGVRWTYPLIDNSRRSFVGHLPCQLSVDVCRRFFDVIRDNTDWKQPESSIGLMPRRTGWMVSRGCECKYRYGGIEVVPQEYPKWMLELLEVAMPYCGLKDPESWPNSCNVNLYEDGSMFVGWHADDERLFQGKNRDCRIVSLSLGARRRLEARLNWPQDGERPRWRVALGNGDLLTMEGMTQKHFQHRIPPEDGVNEPRINLTWRWVVQHAPYCPLGRRR